MDGAAGGRSDQSEGRLAHTIQTDGRTWGNGSSPAIAHPESKIQCYTCHSSWNTNCYGCHLAAKVNVKKPMIHNEGDETQVYASYNPEILRTDSFTPSQSTARSRATGSFRPAHRAP